MAIRVWVNSFQGLATTFTGFRIIVADPLTGFYWVQGTAMPRVA
jgi:hypothetical protein